MKKRNIVLAVFGSLLVLLILWSFYKYVFNSSPKVYASRLSLCKQFAENYLLTVQKTDRVKVDSKEWEMAIDVETDMYNLCVSDLNEVALKNYKSWVMDRYQGGVKP